MSTANESSRLYVNLAPGDPAPWFSQRSTGNRNYVFHLAAGCYVVLCFLATAGDPAGRGAMQSVLANRRQFDDIRFRFFGISLDPRDEAEGRLREDLPGIRFYWDSNGAVISRLYGAVPKDAQPNTPVSPRRFWIVLDPTLRVLRVFPFAADGSDASALFQYLDQLPPPERFAGVELQAPILFLPNVFEPEFCRRLIDLYETHGGEESGFLREVSGELIIAHDHAHKRRKDYRIRDNDLIRHAQNRVGRRIGPEILKVYSFKVTRIERYIVSCYSAEDRGHYRPHRDNDAQPTAHRRFSVSVNLNAEFDGGELSFPEYGPRSFKSPPGAAVVFPCALLHAVSPVTHGRRYAFLPFLYDEEGHRNLKAYYESIGKPISD
jgi:peroxiredoxin